MFVPDFISSKLGGVFYEEKMLTLLVLVSLSVLPKLKANSDLITDLPGLSWKPTFKHYSGYLQATGTKRLHYWFVESANNPAKDPVVLWLNGGPGCSSLEGLLQEHGPFFVTADGATLKKNPYSWNKVANMLYLEAPAGVGFSYSSDKQYKTNDNQVAEDNYAALKSFFKMYPDYKRNDLYLTGESYGGFYIPVLSVLIAKDGVFNFKGLAVGNGLSSHRMNDNSLVYFAYYHGLYGKDLWNTAVSACCNGSRVDRCDFVHSQDAQCQVAISEVTSMLTGLNIYNLYSECYKPDVHSVGGKEANTTVISVTDLWLWKSLRKHSLADVLKKYKNVKMSPPCVNATALKTYLNDLHVRHALHIPDDLPAWDICSAEVSVQYTSDYANMTAQYLQLLAAGKYRILLYNGDVDMACNFFGDEWFVDSLQQKLLKPWSRWYYTARDGSKQIAGFTKHYQNLTFVTIKGAGHMVPSDKPIPALEMFTNFINNKM